MTALLLAMLWTSARAVVIDRSIAMVNGHMVTWSDLNEEMRFEALENRRPLQELTVTDRYAAFDHLVQKWILQDQMLGMFPASQADVDTQIAELRSAWHMEKNDAGWEAILHRYGISPEQLRTLVASQQEILRYLELRLRPLVHVTQPEVQDYYSQTLVPKVEAQGQKPEPLANLRSQIRRLLVEQKMTQEMETWLAAQRAQSQVQVLWDGVR
jgi:peptidyl-prolyl cis-trans isomerase SurA